MKKNEINKNTSNSANERIDKKIDAISWALFFIMIGCLGLMPKDSVPEGTWLVGTAIIIFGSSVFYYNNGLKVSGFWIVMGVIALGTGLSDILGVSISVFPILIIIIGLSIIVKPSLNKKRIKS